MSWKILQSAMLAFGLLACFGFAEAEETEHEHGVVHCLSLSFIRSSEVLDNQHLAFRMNNGDYYLNALSHSCPGLSRNTPFMYRTSLSRLCDLDIITVLDQFGYGMRPGASCGLGLFVPISKEELDAMKANLKKKR